MHSAIDFYARGKEQEVSARDYIYGRYPKGRFVCPECGEYVFLTKDKSRNQIFRHYNRTDSTPECEKRVDTVPVESIYERIGLPLYLKEEQSGHYRLFISFRAIPSAELNLIERERLELKIDDRIKYKINSERFSSEHSYWIPIDHMPTAEHYKISYIGNKANQAFLIKHWGNYAEALLRYGAVFKCMDNGAGRKLHKGDSISIGSEYYWAIRDPKMISDLPGIQRSCAGKLILSKRAFFVYRVSFSSKMKDAEFNRLSYFFLKELKLHLLEKESTIFPIWPPVVKQGDSYISSSDVTALYGAVESGNVKPIIFGYYRNDSLSECLNVDKNSIVKLRVKSDYQYFVVDRKNVSTGLNLKRGSWLYDEVQAGIDIAVNNDHVEPYGKYQCTPGVLTIDISSKAELVIFCKKTVQIITGEEHFEVRQIEHMDFAILYREAEILLVIDNSSFKDLGGDLGKQWSEMLIRYENTYSVAIPYTIRKKLAAVADQYRLIRRALEKNAIPLVVLRIMEKTNNV